MLRSERWNPARSIGHCRTRCPNERWHRIKRKINKNYLIKISCRMVTGLYGIVALTADRRPRRTSGARLMNTKQSSSRCLLDRGCYSKCCAQRVSRRAANDSTRIFACFHKENTIQIVVDWTLAMLVSDEHPRNCDLLLCGRLKRTSELWRAKAE